MPIKFIHTCDIAGVRYLAGTTVDTSELSAEWLAGALKQGFVMKVDAVPQPTKKDTPNTQPPDTSVKVPDTELPPQLDAEVEPETLTA